MRKVLRTLLWIPIGAFMAVAAVLAVTGGLMGALAQFIGSMVSDVDRLRVKLGGRALRFKVRQGVPPQAAYPQARRG